MNTSEKTIAPTADDFPIPQETPGHLFGSLRRFFSSLVDKVSQSHVRLLLGMLAIFALVFIVYSPILPGHFIMDDHRLVKDENSLVTGEFSPQNIWFQTDFPLSAVGWWLQWLVWGDNPGGYHAVNMLLHALSAVLLWRLFVRLEISGAWLIGVMFAVHPVCVNSVARIAEIKNTLSLPFFLLSFWSYLRYEDLSLIFIKQKLITGKARRDYAAAWYGLSLVAFVLALLSKTSIVMLPVVLLGCAAWQRRRITRQDVLPIIPYFILAAGFGLMSVWFQKNQALAAAGQTLAPESFVERFAIMGRVVWFYLGKALLPINLNIVYARWKFDASSPMSYVPVILLFGTLAACWRYRAGWGRAVLFGLGCFIITLFPVIGFFNAQYLVKWQVSDHLQYLPLIAPVALMVAGLASVLSAKIFRWVGVILVLALSVLTFHRAQLFSSEESLFRDTLAKNPSASGAHNDLGVILVKRQNLTEATEHFVAAVQFDPDNAGAHLNLGQALVMNGKFAEADPHFAAAIRLKPDDALAHRRYADTLSEQGRYREAILQLHEVICLSTKPDVQTRLDLAGLLFKTGNSRQAVEQFHKVLLLNPDLPESLNNLAWLQATSPDDGVRDGAEAVQHAERACRLTDFKETAMISTLAAAYAEAGRFPEAITSAEMALKLQTAAGETQFADINRHLLGLYRSGKPFHERPAVLLQ
ncbi:MAG TPA: tetratricopeptide repeat protein [Verrucomicrobiae bacterium]|nr:tetratricopeptide repeat protein [Verrucomicrobiae bacterium]